MSKYHIVPKKDFGPYGFRINGEIITEGFIVTAGDDHKGACSGCNIMPGATWFRSIRQAMFAISVLEKSKGKPGKFWELMTKYKEFA